MLTTTRERFKFFHEYGGGQVGQQAIAAMAEARAYAALQVGIEDGTHAVVWEDDDSPDVSWMDARELERYNRGDAYMLSCRIVKVCPTHGTDCRHAETLAACGGIHLYDPPSRATYARVMEAELACEVGLATFLEAR